MTLDIDGIYIIVSAVFEPDRLKYLNNYFSNNPIDIPVHYIEPFYVDRDENKINFNHYGPALTRGEKMLAATYEKLFEDILKIPSNQKIIVFESDVIFCPKFKEKISTITDEWVKNSRHPSIVFFGGAQYSLNKKFDEKTRVSESLYLINTTRCADSMLFDREAMQILYQNMKRTRQINKPVDILWNDYFSHKLFGYWTNESLTRQGSELGIYKTIVRKNPRPTMFMVF